jgi:hypothetical protein
VKRAALSALRRYGSETTLSADLRVEVVAVKIGIKNRARSMSFVTTFGEKQVDGRGSYRRVIDFKP